MSTTAIARTETALVQHDGGAYSRDQVDLIKRTIAKGATDDELALFVGTAKRLRLDPFARQIFAIRRWDADSADWGMTAHISIDGLRLIADRTGEYLPSEELPEFRYNGKNELVACVMHVLKWRREAWHKVPAIAFFDEYAGRKKAGGLTKNWAEKPHVMLSKCAEALAIRKAFPNETSGVYIPEEFDAPDDAPPPHVAPPPPPPASTPTRATKPMPAVPAPVPPHGPSPRGQQILEQEQAKVAAAQVKADAREATANTLEASPVPPVGGTREPAPEPERQEGTFADLEDGHRPVDIATAAFLECLDTAVAEIGAARALKRLEKLGAEIPDQVKRGGITEDERRFAEGEFRRIRAEIRKQLPPVGERP